MRTTGRCSAPRTGRRGSSTWNKNLADLEAWGLSANRKALLEVNVSVPRGGGVIIGRGVPTSWLTSAEPVSWTNVPVDGGRRNGFTLTRDGSKVSLSVTGDPGGPAYEWATSGQRGVQGFGKDTGSGWTPEPALGDAWLTAETSRPAQR
ncbi:hypothetical protein [Streptomyces sp. SPB78]|uniref:hypothetical protein n=1 Tax=Streptomyces sp. (strain SPB78) TaxID=591157 RepID=UPI0001B559E0|nr:hypothetical protein [Streptomyces sp. SPB78]